MTPLEVVELSRRIVSARVAARVVLGQTYDRTLQPGRNGIRSIMQRDRCNELDAALTLIRELPQPTQDVTVMAILAACGDLLMIKGLSAEVPPVTEPAP